MPSETQIASSKILKKNHVIPKFTRKRKYEVSWSPESKKDMKLWIAMINACSILQINHVLSIFKGKLELGK